MESEGFSYFEPLIKNYSQNFENNMYDGCFIVDIQSNPGGTVH